jgi:SAM-dependent methyltransferase
MPAPNTARAANADQAEYWNGPRGVQWVRLQEELDQRLAPLLDLLLDPAIVRPDRRVLDVGCGTGASLLSISSLVGPGGRVTGVDIATPLLARARERLSERAVRNVELIEADAQTHSFGRTRYDAIVSRFGVMFFGDPVAAFANLRRALAPDGRLAFVCWAPLGDNPWFRLPLAAGIARLGPPEPTPPRAPGPLAFSEPDYVREILDSAGYSSVTVEQHAVTLTGAPTAEEEARLACDVGPVARLIRERESAPAVIEVLQTEIAASLQPYTTDEGVRMPAGVFLVAARRLGER